MEVELLGTEASHDLHRLQVLLDVSATGLPDPADQELEHIRVVA